jgi:c-di-GMP-binding flagellar brake protein YcgR
MIVKETLIDGNKIDYTILVGKNIHLITEQFPGIKLSTKIVSISDNNLVLDKSGSSGKIGQLIHRQNIMVQFEYKSEQVSFGSTIGTTSEGRIQIPLASNVNSLVRRKFIRFDLEKDVRLTFFDEPGIRSARLSKLKWIETSTVNVGGGGVLVVVPIALKKNDYVIMNFAFEKFELPHLILGRVCHGYRNSTKKIVAGIEFITRENAVRMLSPGLIRNLPQAALLFEDGTGKELAGFLEENNRINMEKGVNQ